MRYRYLAATPTDERRSGYIESETPDDALQDLHRQGLIVVRIGRPSIWASLWEALNRDVSLRAPISGNDLADLSQEWAGLIDAGITVDESLEIMISTGRPAVCRVLTQVRDDVKEGAALHEALSHHPACFPATYRTLIQAGETAGSLGATLQRLADDLGMQRRTREEVRNALLYPAFLMVTAVAGITTLLTVVVPNIENLFDSRSRDTLPAATQIVMAISHLLRDHGSVLALALIVPATALIAVGRSGAGRIFVDRLLLKMPVFGSLLQAVETGRFTRSLGALLSGGVAVAHAMPLAVRTIANSAMRRALQTAYDRIMTGSPVGDAIAASGVMPADAIGLIRMGERTGRLDTALERIASLYEGRAARRLKALTTILTPVLTIGFGLVAGVIVYAMLSTILSINDLARP